MTGIPGAPPDLREPPGGCAFHPRCEYAVDRCRTDVPLLAPPRGEDSRTVACWRQDPSSAEPVPAALAPPGEPS
jgi:oligopeptide/dipeptide ABC transporter ATP-binding protein